MDTIKVISCGCCAYKDEGRKDAFGKAYGCVCHNHMDIPNGIMPGICSLHQEPRASVMPAHMASIDPLFQDAASREFAPETAEQEEAMREKVGAC